MKSPPASADGASERCLIFVHIPKTGGATLQALLARQYPPAQHLRVDSPGSAASEVQEAIASGRRLRLIDGHAVYGIHRYLDVPHSYITLLRDPVELVVSLYNYILRKPQHRLHTRVKESGLDLEQYVASGIDIQAANVQTQRISGRVGEQCDEETLALAMANLSSKFAVVGVTSHFDDFLILCKRQFGWTWPIYARRNVAKHSQPASRLPESTVNMIERMNRLDLELYEHARLVAAGQLKAEGRSVAAEVLLLKTLNRLRIRQGYEAVRRLYWGQRGRLQ